MRPHRQAVILAPFVFILAACVANPSPNRRTSSARRAAADIGCLDTLHASDSVATMMKMSVSPEDPQTTLPLDFERLFAEAFRPHFTVPSTLSLSVVTGLEPCDSIGSRCVGGVLNVGAVAYVTAYSDGSISNISVIDVALTSRLASNVRSALEIMSQTREAPWIGRTDSIPLVITLVAEEQPDTVPPSRYVFRTQVPRYDVPFSYAAMPLAASTRGILSQLGSLEPRTV